jgi:predicted nucleic-acid-binding protein
MIGIDTNVLLRLIVADDPRQASLASKFIRSRCTSEDPGFVSNIVLAELTWTLARAYSCSRVQIAGAIEQILETMQLQVESSADVAAALQDYRTGQSDFADCLIGHVHRTAQCSHTVTFDRKAAKLTGFEPLTGA